MNKCLLQSLNIPMFHVNGDMSDRLKLHELSFDKELLRICAASQAAGFQRYLNRWPEPFVYSVSVRFGAQESLEMIPMRLICSLVIFLSLGSRISARK